MLNDISTEADVLRCGYQLGYFDKPDIVAWADRQIEATDTPSNALLDLSMIRLTDPMDVTKLLRSLGPVEPTASTETEIGFIGLLLTKQHIPIEKAIEGLWALVDALGITPEEERQIHHIDYGYELAIAGTYGTMADLELELHKFVEPYATRLAERHPHLIPSKN